MTTASPTAVRYSEKLNRMRLESSKAQKDSVRAEKERWAAELQKWADDEKARQSRQRIPPTRERHAKGDITNKSDRTGSSAQVAPDIEYQVKDPLDTVRKYLTSDEIASLGRFIINVEHANRTRSITANYEGANGGGYGPRHGGLPDASREAATVAGWMVGRMHPKFRHLAELLFYGVQRLKGGSPLTPREIMALFYPGMGDKSRKDGGFIVLCGSLSWRIQELERELAAAEKGETRKGLNHVKQIVRERGE